jgi:hypothetical protein
MADDRISGHEPIWIVTVVGAAGQSHCPIGDDQTETVPASPPRLSDTATVQDDMIHSRLESSSPGRTLDPNDVDPGIRAEEASTRRGAPAEGFRARPTLARAPARSRDVIIPEPRLPLRRSRTRRRALTPRLAATARVGLPIGDLLVGPPCRHPNEGDAVRRYRAPRRPRR